MSKNRWHKKKYGSAWSEIEKAIEKSKNISDELSHIAYGSYGSTLFGIARGLVRYSQEIEKPNGKRLREFSDGKITAI